MPSFCIFDIELFCSIVKVKLVFEVRREEVWQACVHREVSWESFDSEVNFPFDLLSIINTIWSFPLVYIFSCVNCADEIINDFHHLSRIFTEVKSLHR